MSRLKEGKIPRYLPASPLAQALERALDPSLPRDEACEQFGTSNRSLSEWMDGRRLTVQFNKADQILCGLGLNWWEVWNAATVEDPAELDRVRRGFTGMCQDPCPREVCDCLQDEFEQMEMTSVDPMPVAMEYGQAVKRAAYLRNSDPTIFSWRVVSRVMAEYHGWERHADWWRRELVNRLEICEPMPHGNQAHLIRVA